MGCEYYGSKRMKMEAKPASECWDRLKTFAWRGFLKFWSRLGI